MIKSSFKIWNKIYQFSLNDCWSKNLRLRLWPTAKGRSFSGPIIRLRPKVKIAPTVQHCHPYLPKNEWKKLLWYVCKLFYFVDKKDQKFLECWHLQMTGVGRKEFLFNIWLLIFVGCKDRDLIRPQVWSLSVLSFSSNEEAKYSEFISTHMHFFPEDKKQVDHCT